MRGKVVDEVGAAADDEAGDGVAEPGPGRGKAEKGEQVGAVGEGEADADEGGARRVSAASHG